MSYQCLNLVIVQFFWFPAILPPLLTTFDVLAICSLPKWLSTHAYLCMGLLFSFFLPLFSIDYLFFYDYTL
eukprot:c23200_g1_i1 orf=30-242(+)